MVIFMKRRFKAKRKRKNYLIWWLFLIVLSLIINNKIIDKISFGYLINDSSNQNLFNFKFDKEKLLLALGLNYHKILSKDNASEQPVFNEQEYINPKIYIYNSHQTEDYSDGDVLKAGELLKNELESHDIDVVLETRDVANTIKEQNLQYKDSYKITRGYLEENISDNYALYIDLHRDSSNKETTTYNDGEKNYARLMFVVGAKHDTYKDNYRICDELNKLLKNNDEKITRGIFVRKSSSYNQDLNSHIILIELGGPYNTMEEVSNTIKVLADTLAYYVSV